VERYFRTVVFGGDTPNRKPHPEALLLALERMGVAPGRAAYVGDSPEDVEMARAAGVRAVGVPGGFPNREGAGRLATGPAGPRRAVRGQRPRRVTGFRADRARNPATTRATASAARPRP
jgi:beta-phosphoglucomutase-like phosphatase (HAD superfamily)